MKSKKIISFLIASLLLISMCFASYPLVKVDAEEMRDVTAFELISEIKIGINIGNSLDSVGKDGETNETSWGNPVITKQLIQKYKELGFDTIRLPVTWRNHIDSNGVPSSSWLNRVKEVVNWILDEDLKCILNTHHEQNWLNTSSTGMETREKKFANLWTVIADKFKDYDENLMFEAYNEILKKESDWSAASYTDYQNANKLSQVFVDAVRKTGGNNDKRILIINTYGAMRTVNGFKLPKDTVENKLAVQFHSYDPGGFCFEGSNSTWSNSDEDVIQEYCYLFYENFVKNEIPVILGEFGAVNKNNEAERARYASAVVQNCVNYGIKPIWWDDGGDFVLINRYDYSVTFPQIVSALIGESIEGVSPNVTTYTDIDYSTNHTTHNSEKVETTTKEIPSTTIPEITVKAVESVDLNVLNKRVIISWSIVPDADFYRIYKSCNSDEFKLVSTETSNMFNDSDFNGNNTYEYRVVACKKYSGFVFESDYSAKTISPTTTTQPTDCEHNTEIVNKLESSYFATGYSGDVVCSKCDDIIDFGKVINKLKLKQPNFTVKAVGKKLKISYKKVTGATGFQVRYRIKGKWKAKNYNAKKNATKLIKVSKKGNYKVQIRAKVVSNGKAAYSAWTNTKSAKVK